MELIQILKKVKYNTELSIYYGLLSYTEIVMLIEEGAIPTGGYQYELKHFKHQIEAGKDLETYFYFKINSGQLEKFGQK